MQPIDIIAVPYAIIMTTPLVILTLALLGYMCYCIGSIHQEVSMQLTDIECDEEDYEAYMEKEKDKKTLPLKTQCAILAHWNPYEQYVLPMIKKEFNDYYVAYLGIS